MHDLVDVRNFDFASHTSPLRIEDGQRGSPTCDGRDSDLLTGAVPRTGRLDELHAREVRIGRRARQPPDDASGRGVGDEQINREEAPRREEG